MSPEPRDPFSGIVPPEFRQITLTEAEMEAIARAAAKQAVQDVFLAIGIDVSGPDGILSAQHDWAHLKKWRKAVDKAQAVTTKTVLVTLLTGIFGLLWMGFGDAIRKLIGMH